MSSLGVQYITHFLCMQVKQDIGDVTILVNNAGIVTGRKIMDVPDDKAELTFQVNTTAHFWVSMLCR